MDGAQCTKQHVVGELRGRELAEVAVEPDLDHVLRAQFAERIRPGAGQGQAERRVLRAEQLARVGFERQHGQGGIGPGGMGGGEHLGVAAVHAVEVAERHDGAPHGGGQHAPVLMPLHGPVVGEGGRGWQVGARVR